MPRRKLSPAVELAARLVRHLPSGRNLLLRRIASVRPGAPFVARMPQSKAGFLFECAPEDMLTWDLFCRGHYELHETRMIRDLLEPGDTFVDVGANWGYFTLLAAERVGPTGRVVAIEADPRTYDRLSRNIALNGLGTVTPLHTAVSDRAGVLTLVGYNEVERNHGVSHIRGTAGVASAGRITKSEDPLMEVPAATIDSLLDTLGGIDRIDLLKLDIEGAEALALPGMVDGLRAGRYRRIAFELHGNVLKEYGSEPGTLLGILRDADYRSFRVESDGLIALDGSETLDGRSMLLCLAPGEKLPLGPTFTILGPTAKSG